MRSRRWPIAGWALLASCGPSPFVCETDDGCTAAAGGRCESNGACSYPDSGCDSGRRFSRYGPSLPGECVAEGDDTTGTTASQESSSSESGSDGSSTGGVVDACGGCSGHGTCVAVDGEPTCACEIGWTMVGLGCREDPCEQSRCFFVDSAAGDDDGPGTREDPWETLGRGLQHFEGADPGDHVLLRRGRTFQGDHAVASVVGAPDAPLVVGAYGPIDEPRPRVVDANVRLSDSEHLVLRDLELVGTGGDPCLFVARSGYLTVRDSEIRDCGLRAARIGEESHHTVMFRNEILDVGNKTAIFISDTNWSTPPATIGLHHWIAGNRITNNGEHAVDVGFDAALREGDEVGDIKIVGNEIVDVDRAIRMHAPGTWVLGNVVAGVPDPAIPVDGISVQQPGSGHVEYNVVTGTSRALNVAAPAYVGQNSLLQAVAADAVVNVAFAAQGASFTNNVVFTQGTAMLDTLAAVVEDLDALDGNAYAGGSCLFRLDGVDLEFSSWQTSTGVDTLSRCEPVPGLSVPAEFATVDAAFWDAVTPSEAWEGCGAIGAIDCSGERRPLIFQPQDAVGEDGVGWRGPLIIQQHYPLEP